MLERDRPPFAELAPNVSPAEPRWSNMPLDKGARAKDAVSPLRARAGHAVDGIRSATNSHPEPAVERRGPSRDFTAVPEQARRKNKGGAFVDPEMLTHQAEPLKLGKASAVSRSPYDRTTLPLQSTSQFQDQNRLVDGKRMNHQTPEVDRDEMEWSNPPRQFEERGNQRRLDPEVDEYRGAGEGTLGFESQLARSNVPSHLIETRSVNDLANTISQNWGGTIEDGRTGLVDRQIKQVSLKKEPDLERTVDFERDQADGEIGLGQTAQAQFFQAIEKPLAQHAQNLNGSA